MPMYCCNVYCNLDEDEDETTEMDDVFEDPDVEVNCDVDGADTTRDGETWTEAGEVEEGPMIPQTPPEVVGQPLEALPAGQSEHTEEGHVNANTAEADARGKLRIGFMIELFFLLFFSSVISFKYKEI